MKLSLAVTDFLLSREGASPRTVEWYDAKLQVFCSFLPGAQAEDVTAAQCQAFLKTVRERAVRGHDITGETVHGYARACRAFLRYCIQAGWVDARQRDLFKMPKRAQRLIPLFSPRQVSQLLFAAERRPSRLLRLRDAAIVWTLLDTGIRASELLGLTEDHLHLSARDSYLTVVGKGNKQRMVGPLGAKCQRALVRYLQERTDDPHVFQTDDGHALSLAGLDTLLKWLRDESGVSGVRVSAHTFRHTYAVSYLSQPGANLYKLKLLLGHTSIVTTEVYLRAFEQREARRGASVADHFW